jgi:NAD(P)H-dependent flavin oxidoreductase YrpB (nitropropane dioxygenase family)
LYEQVMRTSFTELVGCTVPIQLAAVPGVGAVPLAAAVADAGGLAMVGLPMLPGEAVRGLLADLRAKTTGVFGANFLMPFLDRDCVPIAAAGARVVEFFYADPDPALVELVHAGGALASWQVGSLSEARAAVAAGCDLIVVQGAEAGGHVRGRISLLPLLGEVLDAVSVPVLAAGGIATGRQLAAVLAAGAAGARIGTRFVAAAESEAHPDYLAALLRSRGEDTVLTETFSAMWPNAPHRVLRSCVDAAAALTQEIAGEEDWGGQRLPIPRFGVAPPSRTTRGAVAAMALYAGEGVGAVTRVQPAAEIIRELIGEAERCLRSAVR